MTRLIGVGILLLSVAFIGYADTALSVKTKTAFAFTNINFSDSGCKCGCTETGKCVCKNCNEGNSNANCVCGCVTTGVCVCKDCNHSLKLSELYAKAIKDGQVIVLEVADVPHMVNTPWKTIPIKTIPGEKPGYIVGVPVSGQLRRIDFPANVSRERMRLDILHVIYPLTSGYIECPTCPQGRILVGTR